MKVEANNILADVEEDEATLEEVKENLDKLVSLRGALIKINSKRKALDDVNSDSETEEKDEKTISVAVKKLRDKKKAGLSTALPS